MPSVCLLFFLSGFAALSYELIWFRTLGLVFGNTVQAAATVTAAFMCGLALGGFLSGKWADRSKRPIRLFGLLEIIVGLYALCLPMLFMALRLAYRFAYQNLSEDPFFLTLFRFVFALLLLLIPTTLMGATLAVLSRGLAPSRERFGTRLGLLYGINTFGAVVGILVCGFVLMPLWGPSVTNSFAVAVSAFTGIAAWFLSRRLDRQSNEDPVQPVTLGGGERPVGMWLLLIGAGLSGFVSLGFEVVSFRALTLVYGSTTYSFSAMLSVFLVGIAIGSMVFSRLAGGMKRPVFWFAITQMGAGVCMVFALYQFNSKPEFLLRYLQEHGLDWRNLLAAQFAITFSLLFLPTFFFGGAFAVVAKALRETSNSSSRTAGELYAFNTVGAMAGALVAGFAFLPVLGLERTILVLAALAVVVGLVALFGSGASVVRVRITAGVVALWLFVVLMWPPGLDEKILSAGAYFAPWNFLKNGKVSLHQQLRAERLLLYREGRTATVSAVLAEDEMLHFVVNGKVEADTSARSMVLQRMMGHLPMLFHPRPRRVLNIGLGAGMTLGALGCYPVDRLEVVEIEPVVQEATRIFGDKNDHVVDRPDLIVTINDGRNLLFATSQQYDVITSDPFEPVAAGAANLYTVEHFEQARARLSPGGIMAQYVPLYEMSKEDYATIIKTFVHVFPSSMLFYTGFDTILVGWKDDGTVDFASISRKFDIPAVQQSLADVGFGCPESILDMFVADMKRTALPSYAELNTDGHPVIEFSTPKNTLRYMPDTNQRILSTCLTAVPAYLMTGLAFDRIERSSRGHEALKKALSSSVCRAEGENEKAFALLMEAVKIAPESPVVRNEFVALLMGSAQNLIAGGELQEASMQYQVILNYSPNEFWALYHMVNMAMQAREPDIAAGFLERGLRCYPDSPLMIALRGKYKGTMGDVKGACDDLRRAVGILPGKAELWEDYAFFLRAAGDWQEAGRAEAELHRLRL